MNNTQFFCKRFGMSIYQTHNRIAFTIFKKNLMKKKKKQKTIR